VLTGPVIHPFEAAAAILPEFLKLCQSETVTRDSMPAAVLAHGPDGKKCCFVVPTYLGPDLDRGVAEVKAFRTLGQPVADMVHETDYYGLQTSLDPFTGSGFGYERAALVKDVKPAHLSALIDAFANCPKGCESSLFALMYLGDSAINDVAPHATAFPHRAAKFWVLTLARYNDAAGKAAGKAWLDELRPKLRAVGEEGVYANALEATDPAEAIFGANLRRLQQLKAKYDPSNVFHHNNNILPVP
jgi:hypothetical protein